MEDIQGEPLIAPHSGAPSRSPGPEEPAARLQQLEGAVAQLKESMEWANTQTAAELARLKAQHEIQIQNQDDERASRRRSSKGTWVVLLLLAAALLGAAWYGFPLVRNHAGLLAQLRDSIGVLGSRIDAGEREMRAKAGEWNGLGARLSKVEHRLAANLQMARDQSREMAARIAQVGQELRAELDQRVQPLQARLDRVESNQQTEQANLKQLRNEVGGLRKDTTDQISAAQEQGSRDIADIARQVQGTTRDVAGLSKQIERNRVDFEIAKNQTRELIPGISLKVTHTNPSYQNVDGYLQLLPEGQTLWVKGQDIQQPVVFFAQGDKRPIQLVFTRINKDSVIGYCLIPGDSATVGSVPQAGETSSGVIDSATGGNQFVYSAVLAH